MSKITNVRLPSPSVEYNVQQMSELIRAIETVILTLNTSYSAEENKLVMERMVFSIWRLNGNNKYIYKCKSCFKR
jgi:hypothetical protein